MINSKGTTSTWKPPKMYKLSDDGKHLDFIVRDEQSTASLGHAYAILDTNNIGYFVAFGSIDTMSYSSVQFINKTIVEGA